MDERLRQLRTVKPMTSFRQAGIMVMDGSPSMEEPASGESSSGSKGEAVGLAVNELIAELQGSRSAQSFFLGGVVFDGQAYGVSGPTSVSELSTMTDRDPTRVATGNGTRMASGLLAAEPMVQEFLREDVDGLPASVVVMVLTDGEDQNPEEAATVAARLAGMPRVRVTSAYFGSKGAAPLGLDLVRRVCTQPAAQHSTTVYTGAALRRFFLESMTLALPAGTAGQKLVSLR